MKIKDNRVVCEIHPKENNPRNSEGAFVRLKDGNILFAYSCFYGNSNHDGAPCCIAGLILDGQGEKVISKEPFIIVHPKDLDADNLMCPSFLECKDGTIGLIFGVKRFLPVDRFNRSALLDEYIMIKSDGDINFDLKNQTLVSPTDYKYYVLENDRVTRLKTGRIILPFMAGTYTLKNGKPWYIGCRGEVTFTMSDDDGKTWYESTESMRCINLPYTVCSDSGLQEPGVIELPDGRLFMYARTDLGYQYGAFSYDGGLNWTALFKTEYSSPLAPMTLKCNPYSGKYYAVYNPIPQYVSRIANPHHGGRCPFVLSESENGVHISSTDVIENDFSRGYCYFGIMFLDEKTMLVSYCGGDVEHDGDCLNAQFIRKITLE